MHTETQDRTQVSHFTVAVLETLSSEGYNPDPQNALAKAGRDVESFSIPGSHFTVLKKPNVGVLAKSLVGCPGLS